MDVILSPRSLWEPQKSREPAGAQSKKAQRMNHAVVNEGLKVNP